MAVAAFLTDEVDAWLGYYGSAKRSKLWGTREDQYMLAALPEGGEPYYVGGLDGVAGAAATGGGERVQREHGLAAGRVAGGGLAHREHDRVAWEDEAGGGGDVGHEVLGVRRGGVAGAAGALEHGGAVQAVGEADGADGDRVDEADGRGRHGAFRLRAGGSGRG